VTHLLHVLLWLATVGSPHQELASTGVRHPSPPPVRPVRDSGEVTSLDTTLARAGEALARGRPWQATRLLSLALRDTSRHEPAVSFLAATAASEWGGWGEVLRLLSGEQWIDTLYGGRARVLLARAALERRSDSVALEHAVAAVRRDSASGERLLLLGFALDRVDARDSAAAVYLRAADRLPQVADWIKLRAAAVTDDGAERAHLLQTITDDLPRARIPWTEAAALARTGDRAGAARRYAALGDRLTALKLRVGFSPDRPSRAAVRRDLLAFLSERPASGAAREAIALLDSSFAPLTSAEQLVVARAAVHAGWMSRAVAGFGRVPVLGAGDDRFDYGTSLSRVGRNADAATQFARVRPPHRLAGIAAYQSGRSLVRDGQLSAGREALIRVARDFPRDTAAAASAFFLRADLAADDRGDDEARRLYHVVADRYPTSRFAPTSRFRAAMIALLSGRPALAAVEFDSLAAYYPRSDEALGAIYWAGRGWAAAGDSATARERWAGVTSRDPISYYAALSAARLGIQPWTPPAGSDSFPVNPAIDAVIARAELLKRLGFAPEARWELDRLARSGDSTPDGLLALANALRSQGMASQAIQLARRALARGAAADARTYRLIYPITHEDALLAEAAEQKLDPNFVAALIRQESNFNPSATSPAGARGLAQVMPELGERLARELHYPVWDPVLLYQPDVSIQLGAFHLKELLSRYDQRAHILAAYNAGMSRVELWSKRVGVDDPEVFAERISFVETRDYVRIIQRNEQIYRALYGPAVTQRAEVTPPSPAPGEPALTEQQM
jgi:soluble lytic murein transglycosylase